MGLRCFVFERRHLDQATVAMSNLIGTFDPGDNDLHQNGTCSLARVSVTIALKDALAVEFLDLLPRTGIFESVDVVREALESLSIAVAQG